MSEPLPRTMRAVEIERPEPHGPVDEQHGRDDGAEHHLEHGHVTEVKLRGKLLCVAEARAFEHETEQDAERDVDDRRCPGAPRIEVVRCHGYLHRRRRG